MGLVDGLGSAVPKPGVSIVNGLKQGVLNVGVLVGVLFGVLQKTTSVNKLFMEMEGGVKKLIFLVFKMINQITFYQKYHPPMTFFVFGPIQQYLEQWN